VPASIPERRSKGTMKTVMAYTEDELATPAGPHDFDALFRAERDGVYRTMIAFTGGQVDVADEATAEA
jgi:hypothetical protein